MALGRLNYVNRKSEGVKLGQIVAKDVRKKSEKKEKDQTTTTLEVCLTGKKITDEGVREMADGLVDALLATWPDGTPRVVLKELELASNDLTASCLPYLARVIRLAAPDITLLDISSNKIAIKTVEEADNWREFLQAFRHASSMRRLILSRNDFSGPAAMEILAQIYSRHPQITIQDTAERLGTSTRNMGLRSIPYIILSNVELQEVGALWLSYVVEAHQFSQALIKYDQLGPVEKALLTSYKENIPECDGLVYQPQPGLSQVGQKVLKAAEESRGQSVAESSSEGDGSLLSNGSDSVDHSSETRSRSDSSSDFVIVEHDMRRKTNVYSLDLGSLRRKLQRAAIEDGGHRRIELWSAALRMVASGRIILAVKPRQHDGLSKQRNLKNNGIVAETRQIQPDELSLPWPDFNRTSDLSIMLWKSLSAGSPLNVPQSIWTRILCFATDPKEALSDDQVEVIMSRASSRITMELDRAMQAKGETHQIWHLLEASGCLAYKIM